MTVLLGLTMGALAGCAGSPVPTVPAPRAVDALLRADEALWVVAPHPDDEVLMAGEVLLQRAAVDARSEVYVVTNGDFTCERDGLRREGETIEALASLGVDEEHVHFLGYPDGYLTELTATPLPPIPRRDASGACIEASGTYGTRGAHRTDVHRARTGEAGIYTRQSAVDDLARALASDLPRHIIVAHPFDAHPDHATTYLFLRDALDAAGSLVGRPFDVTVHRAMVHAGRCWPNGSTRGPVCPPVVATFGTPMPPLPDVLAAWPLSERIRSLDGGARKREAIARYVSQLDVPVASDDWLSSFARTDEVFDREELHCDASGCGGRVLVELTGPVAAHVSLGTLEDGTPVSLHREELRFVLDAGPMRLVLGPPVGETSLRVLRREDGLAELEVRDALGRRALWPWPSSRPPVVDELIAPDHGTSEQTSAPFADGTTQPR